jgi:PAS domain S-box-containing protein
MKTLPAASAAAPAAAVPALVRTAARDISLDEHLTRIDSYMRGCGLFVHSREPGALRDEFARFLRAEMDGVLDEWVVAISAAFVLAPDDAAQVRRWMDDAMERWVRHVENPRDVETYVYLRSHARDAFISGFPASRFLSGQMLLNQIFTRRLVECFAAAPERCATLMSLLQQEFNERMLNISDFFVEAREDELREQEASYRKSIDNAPAAIFRLDPESGTVLDANVVAERTVDFPRAEMVGMQIGDLIPAEDRPRAMRLFEETRRRGHSRREDLHLRRRDGRLVPVFFNGGLIEYRQRSFLQVICVDISDRKRLESQLIQSEKMAAIGQLAAGIAHEIRNPLGIITNALFDLGEIVDSEDPDVLEDLRIAKEEMRRVQEIINNLLEFSRESRAETERVDVNDLLRRTVQLMRKSLEHGEVHVTMRLADVGACQSNQNAIRQVILNLITNAVQAMPDGGELTLATSKPAPDRLRLEVSDTGVGIPPEHIKDIFNPFFTTKAPGQGTGLGLSVVHSVVERYGGDIRVQSRLGVGTTFAVEFPCACDGATLSTLLDLPG